MSIRIVCPSCREVYNLNENMQGKTVLCRECRSRISVPSPARQGRRENGSRPADERIATSSRQASAAGRVRRDEDDEPRRRPAERRSRRENEDSQGGKNLLPIFLAVGAGALLLVGLVIGGVLLVFLGRSESSNQAAVTNETPPAPVPAAARVDPAAGAAPGQANKVEADIPAGPLPAEMAASVVQKVKQSTAYLRVRLRGGEVTQGSGFFALEQGIVITNAHVVGMLRGGGGPPSGVDVVIHSGETSEAKLAATLVGLDRENDLAVLRVQGDLSRMPPPLSVSTAANLTETQNVYIFGFPFGAQLGRNITVSASTVASLRRGDDGVLKEVQVNGGMHPRQFGRSRHRCPRCRRRRLGRRHHRYSDQLRCSRRIRSAPRGTE